MKSHRRGLRLPGPTVLWLVSLLLPVHPAATGFVRNSAGQDSINEVTRTGPEFEETETRIAVGIGRTAFLPCRVRNVHDKTVSWIRTRDLHILTSGPFTFTADGRFESVNSRGSANWGLKLRNSQLSDSGTYECQVNTEPKINRKVFLEVVSDSRIIDSSYMADQGGEDFSKRGAYSRILGSEEQFVKSGSTITFTCVVITPNRTVSSVEWLKDNRLISFQAERGGIIVDTVREAKKTVTRLTVSDVRQEDSGNYTCNPVNVKSHSITLVVIDGEHTEAMKRNGVGIGGNPRSRTFGWCTFFLVFSIISLH